MFKNTKLIGLCWSCGNKHDLSNIKVNEHSVKCENCGGYIVTPSGKTQTAIIPNKKIFLFQDNERYWIVADNIKDATDCYLEQVDEDNEYTVIEIDDIAELNEKKFIDNDGNVSIVEMVEEITIFPNCFASTIV